MTTVPVRRERGLRKGKNQGVFRNVSDSDEPHGHGLNGLVKEEPRDLGAKPFSFKL
jgi:hypothetical protein